MGKVVLYRGVSGTEAVIVHGIGPAFLGDRWTTDQGTATAFVRDNGGVFTIVVDASRITPANNRPDVFRLDADHLTDEEIKTLSFSK